LIYNKLQKIFIVNVPIAQYLKNEPNQAVKYQLS